MQPASPRAPGRDVAQAQGRAAAPSSRVRTWPLGVSGCQLGLSLLNRHECTRAGLFPKSGTLCSRETPVAMATCCRSPFY